MVLEEYLRVRSKKVAYIVDYPVITKHDNPEVIREFVKMVRKEVSVVLTYEDLPGEPTDAYRPSKKRKRKNMKLRYLLSGRQRLQMLKLRRL